jgi:exodeoxyribonuclease VII large subunit
VGHQVDFTISDFVADLRAPTPSAAAELAVPDVVELQLGLRKYKTKLSRAVLTYIELARQKLSGLRRSPVFRRPLEFIYRRQQELDDLRLQLFKQSGSYLRERRNELNNLHDRLIALSPEGVLKRGFAVVRKSDDNLILRDSDQVGIKEAISVKLYRGSLKARVSKVISESD